MQLQFRCYIELLWFKMLYLLGDNPVHINVSFQADIFRSTLSYHQGIFYKQILALSRSELISGHGLKKCIHITYKPQILNEAMEWITLSCSNDGLVNSLWLNDVQWREKTGSTLAQLMACCLTAPSHYLTQCWLIISNVQWHSPEANFTRDTSNLND